MLVLRVIDTADYLPDPVLIDKRIEITSVFFIQYLGDKMSRYACFMGKIMNGQVAVEIRLLILHIVQQSCKVFLCLLFPEAAFCIFFCPGLSNVYIVFPGSHRIIHYLRLADGVEAVRKGEECYKNKGQDIRVKRDKPGNDTDTDENENNNVSHVERNSKYLKPVKRHFFRCE